MVNYNAFFFLGDVKGFQQLSVNFFSKLHGKESMNSSFNKVNMSSSEADSHNISLKQFSSEPLGGTSRFEETFFSFI